MNWKFILFTGQAAIIRYRAFSISLMVDIGLIFRSISRTPSSSQFFVYCASWSSFWCLLFSNDVDDRIGLFNSIHCSSIQLHRNHSCKFLCPRIPSSSRSLFLYFPSISSCSVHYLSFLNMYPRHPIFSLLNSFHYFFLFP